MRSDLLEWQQLESPEGRRLVAEAECLQKQLREKRDAWDDIGHRMRDAEEAYVRTSRSASALRSDCGILRGTREALLLEEVSVRERLGAVSRAHLQTSSAVAELREAHAGAVRRGRAEVQEV